MDRWADEPILVPASPHLSLYLYTFGPKGRWTFVHFREKGAYQAKNSINCWPFFVRSCVFMHIVGSIFVFNIFFVPQPVSDVGQRVGDLPRSLLSLSTLPVSLRPYASITRLLILSSGKRGYTDRRMNYDKASRLFPPVERALRQGV